MSPLSFPHVPPTAFCSSSHTAGCRCTKQQGGKSSVYLKCKTSTVLHVERPTGSTGIIWLTSHCRPADFIVTLTDSLITTLSGIPQKNHYHHTPHWQHTATGLHLLPHASARNHTWVDPDGHKSARANWLGQTKSGSMVAPKVPFCHQHLHTDCSAAATAFPPEPVQYNQSATGAADLYPSSPFLSVQYCYSNGGAMLCTYQCEQLVNFIYTQMYIRVHTYIFKLLILHLLFVLALEACLKVSFGDLSILTFKQEGDHKATFSRDGIPLC